MSQSPGNIKEAKQTQAGKASFRTELRQLDDILNRGGSLSGNERNCAFLNLGSNEETSFVNVGSITGLDFKDDGRAYALTDWDQDGDVDIFAMNRTAPRIRFLRNDHRTENRFVSVKLQGTRGNRDAIGARVVLEVAAGGVTNRIHRVLRAGEGFLSQSSKRLAIGLGLATEVKRLVVEWPGGDREVFTNVRLDAHHELVEGSGVAKVRTQETQEQLESRPWMPPVLKEQAAVLLASRIPLPRLPYQKMDGSSAIVTAGKPVLINLWATWCAPCREELQRLVELQDQNDRLQIFALSVDLLGENLDQDATKKRREDVGKVVQLYGQPALFGYASAELMNRLQFLDDLLFAQKRPLPVPTSFLVDQHGALAAVYRGTVENEVIQQDLARLELKGKARYDAALPFPGHWFQPKAQGPPLRLVSQMAIAGHFTDAARYLLKNKVSLQRQPGCGTLAAKLASRLSQEPVNSRLAVELYRVSAEVSPDDVSVLNNLAWLLATKERGVQARQDALTFSKRAAQLTQFNSLNVLDTLAKAHEAAGQTDAAIRIYQRAYTLAVERNDPDADKFQAKIRRLQGRR